MIGFTLNWRTWAGPPAWVLLCGLVLTAAAGLSIQREHDKDARAAFERQAEQAANEVTRRFERSVDVLRGLSSLFAASSAVTRSQFKMAVDARDLSVELPGIRGFGFVERVPRAQLAGFVAEQQSSVPGFALRQLVDRSHDDLYIVKFIEPMQGNSAALGLDVGSEPVRRAAIERAVDSGRASLTGYLMLAQEQRQRPGLLLYLPVYAGGTPPQSVEARRSQLVGLLSTQIVVAELLGSLDAAMAGSVNIEVFDTRDGSQLGDSLFAMRPEAVGTQITAEQLTRALALPGRDMTLRASSTSKLDAGRSPYEFWLILIAGTLISGLMAALAWQLINGRRRAEALASRLSAEARTLQLVAHETVNAVVIMDTGRRITWANASFERLTGFTALEALGRRPIELGLTGLIEESQRLGVNDRLRNQQPVKLDLPIVNRAGSERWVELQFQPLQGPTGVAEGFMAIALDVTERRHMLTQLENALREHEALLQTLNLKFLVSVTDRGGRIDRVNDAFCELSGYSRDELLGQGHNIVNSGTQGPDFWPVVWQTISGGKVWQGEVCNRAKDGSLYWVSTVIAPFKDAQGSIEKYVSIRHDVTQRHVVEDEARRNLQLLRGAIEAINEAFVLFDPQDRIVFCNDKYRQLYGASADLVEPGIQFEDLMRQGAERGQYPAALGRIDEWVAEQMAAHLQESSSLTQDLEDGRTLRLIERKMPDGHIVGFRVDITELVRARSEAEEALRVKGNFLANMSHEIRTPMHAILGMTALLRQTELSSQQADYANKTERAAQSMLGLLNDILDFSKFEAGKLSLDPQPFRMDQLLRDLSVIFSASVGKDGVDVLFDIDPALPRTLVGDVLRLRQVLINLGGNAIKFTHQGEVVVSVGVLEVNEELVRLQFAVRDTGIGIAPENLLRIFQAFTQAEASTTRRFGGTGLGMAISKNLVELMGGELQGESQLGVGSRFHFDITLPTVADTLAETFLGATSARSWRTLVVDDNPLARELLERMGASLGWQVDACASGEEALARLEAAAAQDDSYQVVLVDWQMPGLDGWQTSQAIRRIPLKGPSPLVVMVSAHGREMLAQRSVAEQAMVDGYLIKPITASMLFDAVVDAQAGHDRPHPYRVSAVRRGERLLGMRLLVVEDNVINQQVARELLQNEGAIVQLACDGQEGVTAVAAADPQFDVVLMDLQMPVMDGFGATRHIRDQLALKDLPIVAMTANAMASDRADCLACGMNEHVAKPFDISQVVRLLRLQARWPELVDDMPVTAADPPGLQIRQIAKLAGMDLEAALERLGGRMDIYGRMLRTFSAELAALPDQLHSAVAQNRVPDAKQKMHTLKGLAATLGIPQLAFEAGQAEKQLAAAGSVSEASAVVRQACGAIRAAAPGLVSLLALIGAPGGSSPLEVLPETAESAQLSLGDRLEALVRQLRQGDMAATIEVTALRGFFVDAEFTPFKALEEAIASLDFAQALLLCERLLEGQGAGV